MSEENEQEDDLMLVLESIETKMREIKDYVIDIHNNTSEILDLIGDNQNGSGDDHDEPDTDEPEPPSTMATSIKCMSNPIRTIARHNKAGRPVWGIYGKRVIALRIKPHNGQRLYIEEKPIKGDGGNQAYKLLPNQMIGGDPMPEDVPLFVLVRHTYEGSMRN